MLCSAARAEKRRSGNTNRMTSASQQYPSFSVVFRSSEDADHLNRFLLIFFVKTVLFQSRNFSSVIYLFNIFFILFFELHSIDSLLRLSSRVFPIDEL